MTQKLNSSFHVRDVGSSFLMPVGAGINNVDSDSNKSRFRNFRFSCLRGERKAPTRERGLFESLFYLTDYSCFWVRCRPLKPVTGGKRLQGQRGNGLPPCTVERSDNGFADSKAAVVRQKQESDLMHSSRPQVKNRQPSEGGHSGIAVSSGASNSTLYLTVAQGS